MRRSELASRIWRSVVFSGAMLGGSAVADVARRPEKPAVKKPDTVESVRLEIEKLDARIMVEVDGFVGARDDLGRGIATVRLEPLRKEATALGVRMKAVAPLTVAPRRESTPYTKLTQELVELDAQFAAAVDALTATTSDAARTAAHRKVRDTHKQLLATEVKLTAEIAKTRPRTNPDQRPVGRGFVLA